MIFSSVNTTLRMGSTRIEPLPGGAARLAKPALDAGSIDKVTDGRGRKSPHTEREKTGVDVRTAKR